MMDIMQSLHMGCGIRICPNPVASTESPPRYVSDKVPIDYINVG